MSKAIESRLLPALLLSCAAGAASAAGFQLLEQNASGIGNSYAGSAASAENAATIFYNPAGMTELRRREFSIGLAAVGTRFKFANAGSQVGALGAAGDGGDAGAWGYLPNAYLAGEIGKDLRLGLGVSAPFGMKTEYDEPWKGGAQSLALELRTINLNPSLAWRVNERLSLGIGANWQKLEVDYRRLAATATALLAATRLQLALDDDGWGWNAGALYKLSPATRLGISYRSSISYSLTGSLAVDGPLAGAGAALAGRSVTADVRLPDTWILSASHRLGDRLELLGDLARTGWSSIDKVDIVNASGPLAGSLAQRLDVDFRDTWRVSLGATWAYRDAWKLKFGVAYDQTPVRGPATRLVSLPDNDRTWLSIGAQWRPDTDSSVDFGLARLFTRNAGIDSDQAAAGRGRVVGDYRSRAWVLGVQYSHGF